MPTINKQVKSSRQIELKFLFSHPAHFLSLGFGAGLSPHAPGTVGTVMAIPVYFILAHYFDWMFYAIAVVLITILGFFICGYTARALGEHDHGGIVWDEIAGYLITMFLLPQTWWAILLGFIMFRLFDIWKPFPISWLDRELKGGVGIMMDDVVAGIFAWISVQLIIFGMAYI